MNADENETHPGDETMTKTETTLTVGTRIAQADLCQGQDDIGRDFGYVAGDDGGFFFTWHDSLEETLDSVEEDEFGDGGLDESDVISLLKSHLPTTAKGRLAWGDSYDFGMDS